MLNTNIALLILFLIFMSACSRHPYTPGLRKSVVIDPSIKHEEGRLVTSDDTQLFIQAWLPPTEPKAIVILIHGLKDHSDRYNQAATLLANSGIGTYAFDLRGHGDSSGERVWINRFEDYLSDLDVVMKTVRSRQPNKAIFIMGHSMGGLIATRAAIKKPSEIAGLILSAPALKVSNDISPVKILASKVFGTILPRLPVLELESENFSRDPKIVMQMIGDPLIYNRAGPAHTAKILLTTVKEMEEEYAKVAVPFITLHGSQDKLTNPEGSKELYQKASTKDKVLKIYDGLYHDLLHEPEKDRVMNDILDWVKWHIPNAAVVQK